MRKWPLLFFIATPSFAAAPVIIPSTPIVNQSATVQFSESASEAGTWTCSGTNSTGGVTSCSGSITSGGLYTAPSFVLAQHVYGGLQILPNNSVYNTRIDSQTVHNNSTLYKNTVAGAGGTPNWPTDFPINYVLPNGFTDTMNFTYTPNNNGTFELPTFPNAHAEHGWYSALQDLNDDHHVITVDTVSATLAEMYQYYPNCVTTAATLTGNIATVTCDKNPILKGGFVVGSTVVVTGFSGADTYFNVGSATLTVVTSTQLSYPVNHVNGTATTNGAVGKSTFYALGLRNSQSGVSYSSMSYLLPQNNTTDAAGMELQPLILNLQEFERAATTPVGTINHAFRNTFALAFEASASTWPATAFAVDGGTVPFGARWRLSPSFNISGYSAKAQILLKALQQYGAFNTDGGNNWPMNAEETRWPKAYYDALTEAGAVVITSSIEFVDQGSMMISTNSSLTNYNREIVKFTRTSDNATATTDIALVGPAVNFQQDSYNFIAGTPGIQLNVLNNFGGFSCAMNPSTGTLSTGCLYTPPATLTVATQTIVTATSLINSSMTAQTTVTVYPSTGAFALPSRTADYTDTHGFTWLNRSGIDNLPDNQGCCACDNSGSFSGTDVNLWNCHVGDASGISSDTHLDFYVPNGTYQVIYRYGTVSASGVQFIKYSLGNTEIYSNTDPDAIAGGQFKNFTSTNSIVVTNNLLQSVIWNMNDAGASISSLSAVQIAGPAVVKNPSEIWNGGAIIKGGAILQ